MKKPIDELKEAAEAVIDVAAHPNRPKGLTPGDRIKIARLRRAVMLAVIQSHKPAPWAPRVSKPKLQAG